MRMRIGSTAASVGGNVAFAGQCWCAGTMRDVGFCLKAVVPTKKTKALGTQRLCLDNDTGMLHELYVHANC